MKITQYEIVDLYEQLALLLKSELPLPDALKHLSLSSGKKEMNTLIRTLSEFTEKGKSLSGAMKERPDCFQPFFVKMVEIGESKGTLPAILRQLADMARLNYTMAALLKDIMIYPLITIIISVMIFLLITYFIIPPFNELFNGIFSGRVTFITKLVLDIALFINENIMIFSSLFVAFLSSIVWIYSDRKKSNSIMLWVIKVMPVSEIAFYNFSMARICSLWSIMLKQKINEKEIFETLSLTADIPELIHSMKKISANISSGMSLRNALALELNVSSLVKFTLDNTPEEKFPDELNTLSDLFHERGLYGVKRTTAYWELVSIFGMTTIVGGIIIFLFIPIIFKAAIN